MKLAVPFHSSLISKVIEGVLKDYSIQYPFDKISENFSSEGGFNVSYNQFRFGGGTTVDSINPKGYYDMDDDQKNTVKRIMERLVPIIDNVVSKMVDRRDLTPYNSSYIALPFAVNEKNKIDLVKRVVNEWNIKNPNGPKLHCDPSCESGFLLDWTEASKQFNQNNNYMSYHYDGKSLRFNPKNDKLLFKDGIMWSEKEVTMLNETIRNYIYLC